MHMTETIGSILVKNDLIQVNGGFML